MCLTVTKIRRTESVPSDINNPVDRPPEAPQFGTLPKAITKKVQYKGEGLLSELNTINATSMYNMQSMQHFSMHRIC